VWQLGSDGGRSVDWQAETETRIAAALPVVEAAGRLALQHFRRPMEIDNKLGDTGFDPVTAADRGVEALIRERLAAAYPASPILGEEQGFTSGTDTDTWSWVIDPIDGTRAFIAGLPVWGVLLGLTRDGAPVGGIMRQPYLGESFVGTPAGARLLRPGLETRLRTSSVIDLGGAILSCTHPSLFDDDAEREGFARVSAAARMTRFGGDCYAYCMLAHGLVDLVIEGTLQAYDIVPLIPIVEAAGGVVTDLSGKTPLAGGTVVAAANPALHDKALALMSAA
jgi:histidinol phosphatase-like enzyme (inositol monophosphatase family)